MAEQTRIDFKSIFDELDAFVLKVVVDFPAGDADNYTAVTVKHVQSGEIKRFDTKHFPTDYAAALAYAQSVIVDVDPKLKWSCVYNDQSLHDYIKQNSKYDL